MGAGDLTVIPARMEAFPAEVDTSLRHAAVALLLAGTLIAGCDRPSGTSELLRPGPEPLAEVHGRVVAAGDGQPISGATVAITGTPFITMTDASGRYRFADLPVAHLSSPAQLRAYRDGFTPQLRETPLERGASVTVDFALPRGIDPSPPPAPGPSGLVRVRSSTIDAVRCIAAGDRIEYAVDVANEGTALVSGIVLHDTLDASFGRDLTAADVVVDRANFPAANVILGDDGRSFRVELGTLAPGAPTPVYTVGLPAGSNGGVYCNTVSARAASGAFLDDDVSCVTTTLVLGVDILNEDGAVANGTFLAEKDVFRVGDGSAARPDELVFRVVVTNAHCFALGIQLGGVRVRSEVAPGGQIIEFRAALAGYPDHGTLEDAGPSGFTWRIGSLSPGARAEMRFRAEAVRPGEDVHRIVFNALEFTGSIVNEETITVLP